ncbi:chorismate mutase [Glaciimonas immobilis]|uniref:chorismate mutase n=1 Tax=Glaciimonas immobilis TaxID=728004 RepID=A0A840RRY0_9BURK|nr:chorismate mutase [Glaciimonas immobilis]KAF3996902.1 chorismate mutase [Glaciimonas immobilis]MBB5199716.1 chorismate mutase [Glaciimonas immobilis]
MRNSITNPQLLALREQIDIVDAELVRLLGQRFGLTAQVGVLKKEVGLDARDPDRERLQIEKVRKLAADSGVDPDIVENFFQSLLKTVVQKHREV